ncbi:predicted protein, partial [Nematostella vectensis]
SITLVGAGVGNPDHLTLGALRELQTADLVVADQLLPPTILALAGGRLVVANKTKGRAHEAQEEIYDACLAGLRAGQRVVRLKGGDPFVFGRGAEEVLRFRQHGYEARVLPGISSCIAGPGLAGIPLTLRGVADSFVVTTAHGKNDTDPRWPEFQPYRTFVFLMGVSQLPRLHNILTQTRYGFPSRLPMAIVERASHPKQRVLRTTLDQVADLAARQHVTSPAVLILGEVTTCLQSAPN